MRNALLFASLALALAACGDNLNPGGPVDAATIDAAIDAPTDAAIDARVCPQVAAGQPGGPCSSDAQCDSASGAGDGYCLVNAQGGVTWPSQGYCINRLGTCTMDSQCGAGNVCVTIDAGTPDAFSACMTGCAADPCACPDGMLCAASFSGSPLDKMACVPGNAGAIDGSPCAGFGDCDVNSICRNDGFEFPGGQCMQVGCTIGTDTTCSSGGDGHCIDPGFVTAGTGCVDRCDTDADCRMADGYECFDGGGTVGKYCRHPATGDACAADGDCGAAAIWDCRTGASYPGGYCTIQNACNPTNGEGCSPGSSVCYDPAGADTPYCVDRCTGTGQGTCRTGYTCQVITGSIRGCVL